MSQSLTVFGLVLFTEVATTRLFTFQCIQCHQLADFNEVSKAVGLFKFNIHSVVRSRDTNISPEFLLNLPNPFKSLLKTFLIAGHTYEVPHYKTQLLVNTIRSEERRVGKECGAQLLV